MKSPWKRGPKRSFVVPASKIRRAVTPHGNYGGSPDEWDKIRKQVLVRDNHTCLCCFRHRSKLTEGEYLEVHHIRRLSRGGNDRKLGLKTLCSKCHSRQDGHEHLK